MMTFDEVLLFLLGLILVFVSLIFITVCHTCDILADIRKILKNNIKEKSILNNQELFCKISDKLRLK